ncbi:MAG: hypothetical protein Q8T11_11925 [Elusimicrobiota bacterium]|nr:hypothetical protein [Elusimicrobiota bacterium]
MKLCPDCRNPVSSLLFIDGRLVPEPYCERCCKGVAPVERPAIAPREAVVA